MQLVRLVLIKSSHASFELLNRLYDMGDIKLILDGVETFHENLLASSQMLFTLQTTNSLKTYFLDLREPVSIAKTESSKISSKFGVSIPFWVKILLFIT